MSERGWWYRASEAERLAQIDAAIELGMTAKQCAMNCRCLIEQKFTRGEGGIVADYALNHGRHFQGQGGRRGNGNVFRNGRVVSARHARVEDAKDAFLAGEPVDMWGVE